MVSKARVRAWAWAKGCRAREHHGLLLLSKIHKWVSETQLM